jgi:hypothetical protein
MSEPNIDERLAALTVNNELMSHMLEDVMKRIDKLAEVSERHEKNWERTRRVVRAALEASLGEDD